MFVSNNDINYLITETIIWLNIMNYWLFNDSCSLKSFKENKLSRQILKGVNNNSCWLRFSWLDEMNSIYIDVVYILRRGLMLQVIKFIRFITKRMWVIFRNKIWKNRNNVSTTVIIYVDNSASEDHLSVEKIQLFQHWNKTN